jgi:hypothetical protein
MTFPHRHNEDGSFDSICTTCFATVATEENEAKLRLYELAHICNSLQVARIRQASAEDCCLDGI